MQKLTMTFVLGLLAMVSTVQLSAQSPHPVTLLKAARLLDPRTGNIFAPAAVLIESGKIKEVGAPVQLQAKAPTGVKTIDLGNKTYRLEGQGGTSSSQPRRKPCATTTASLGRDCCWQLWSPRPSVL